MFGLNETTDQLAMANSVHWYGHVLRREDGHVLRRALEFEVEGRRKTGEQKEYGGSGGGGTEEVWLDQGRRALPIKANCQHVKASCWGYYQF